MKNRKRSTLFGAALILFGVFLSACAQEGSIFRRPHSGLSRPEATQAIAVPQVQFSAEDEALLAMQYAADCPYRPDAAALLRKPLAWNLISDGPSVLILHTHATESYTRGPGQDYTESAAFRTCNTDYNMVAVGDALTDKLEKAGIGVIHDRTLHDYPSYNESYTNARQSIEEILRQNPSIRLVLDLHRDAILNKDGSQYAATASVGGVLMSRMMMVVGTDASGTSHPAWQENLALALKLQVLLEREAPGLTRPVMLRAQRFNQDESPGALIVELGAAGNTLEQTFASVPYLADAIIALAQGTIAGSTS